MPGSSYLVDSNILLRLVRPDSPQYGIIRECTDRLWALGAELFYTSQNLAESWNVCTRPADRNGFGFSVAKTDERAALIEAKLSFASESEARHQEWRRVVVAAEVSRMQVHDARLVATMRVRGVGELLTLNDKVFHRFTGISAPSPEEVLAALG